jgi:hypothetical protein
VLAALPVKRGRDIQRASRADHDQRPPNRPKARRNIKIIYFLGWSAYVLPRNGADKVGFLVEHFTFLGFQGQYWMLILAAMIAIYILFVWRTGGV